MRYGGPRQLESGRYVGIVQRIRNRPSKSNRKEVNTMNLGASELLLILAIVVVLFGTKKLRTVGSDLGGAIRGFRQALNNDDKALPQTTDNTGSAGKLSETVENRS